MSDEEKNKFMAGFGGQIMDEKHNTVKEAMKTPQFWLWTLSYGLIPGVLLGTMQNLTTIGISYGYDAAAVGILMAYFQVTSIIGRLLGGPIGDRIGKRLLMLICIVISALALFAAYAMLKDVLGMNIFVMIFGLFIMPPIILLPPLLGDMYGRLNMGKIMGFSGMFTTAIVGLCPLIAGMIKSMTGTYNMWLLLSGIFLAVVFVCVFLMRPTATEINNLGLAKKQEAPEAEASRAHAN
jgi:MFS family permease